MSTKKWIEEILEKETETCFRDCSFDNIDKWVEILDRFNDSKAKELNSPVVDCHEEAFDLATNRLNSLKKLGFVKKDCELKFDEGWYVDDDKLTGLTIDVDDGSCSARLYLKMF